MSKKTIYAFSVGDEGSFHGRFSTFEEARDKGLEALAYDVEVNGERFADSALWVGKVLPPPRLCEVAPAWRFVEDAKECACGDFGSDGVDGWDFEPNESQLAELETLIDAWADRHGFQPEFSGVDEVQRVKLNRASILRAARAASKEPSQ